MRAVQRNKNRGVSSCGAEEENEPGMNHHFRCVDTRGLMNQFLGIRVFLLVNKTTHALGNSSSA